MIGSMRQKSVLITGASGFIGSFLVEQALAEGYQVWAGVRESSSKSYLQDERIHFIDLAYGDQERLTEQIREHAAVHGAWDYVVHNAGLTKSLRKEDFDEVNFRFTVHLCEALQTAGSPPQKFILMSSLSAANTQTAYGESKRKAEEYLMGKKDFPSLIMRPTGVYGPREKDYFLMVKTVQSGWEVTAGFQQQLLTFIYVSDLARAVFLALDSPFTHKIYAVADGNVYTDREYAGILKRCLGKKRVFRLTVPIPILYMVSWVAEKISLITRKPSTLNTDKFRIMKQRDWTCDTSPLREDLAFVPEFDLEAGLKACVKWYRENGWL